MRYSLRRQTFDDMLNDVKDLPVVFTGEHEECMAYAEENGFVWKASPKMLFGGYFFKPSKENDGEFVDSEALLPDIPVGTR